MATDPQGGGGLAAPPSQIVSTVASAEDSESGASLPPASGHTSAGKSALKALRQDLANLVKFWYASVRPGQPTYFNKQLWERKGNWQPVWENLRKDINEAGGANFEELRRLLAAINGEHRGNSGAGLRTCTQVLSDVVHEENRSKGPYKNGEPFPDSISPAGPLPGTPRAAGGQGPTELGRFLAFEPVAAHVDSLEGEEIPHGLAIGTRLQKKGSKKHKDHGTVVYIKKDMITVLWMRGEAIQPTVSYTPKDPEWNKLVNWRDAFRDAEKEADERGIPQRATFENLKNCWCAPFPLPPAAAALRERCATARASLSLPGAGLVPGARAALFHHSGCRGSPFCSMGKRAVVRRRLFHCRSGDELPLDADAARSLVRLKPTWPTGP
jgi:hypothetical protein